MTCPETAAIADLVHGEGELRDAAAFENHLGDCERCADIVAKVVTSSWASQGSRNAVESATQGQEPPGPGTGATSAVAGPTSPLVYVGMAIIPPGTRLGRYRVRRWLGRGGMGEVYEGYDPELDRRVALKLLRTRGSDEEMAQRRLRREAKTLARLSHPNVVAALDVGTFGGALFLVMELVEGPTLASWLHLKPRGWREILDMYLAAGEGLAAAHEVGIIHRDFKPQNVLIGVDGKPRVSDFGLAREAEDEEPKAATTPPESAVRSERPSYRTSDLPNSATAVTVVEVPQRDTTDRSHAGPMPTALTRTGAAIGTPRYMAPEQFLRHPLDARVDQFSFCVALYEALYGEHPFDGALKSPRATVVGTSSTSPRHTLRIPRTVASILRRGLSRNRDDRYPTLRDVLTSFRTPTITRRHRLFVATIAVIILATSAGVIAGRPARRPHLEAIEPIGEPDDWSSTGVLARVSGTIHCIHRINDRTLRLIWGTPHQAEDIDIAKGVRRPTNLVPESYRHGCPTLSPDRQQLLFEGYDPGGRPHVFWASQADGRDGRPIVSSTEHSLASEPVWLSSGQAFVFDLDYFHPAVFSISANGLSVVPDLGRRHQGAGFYKSASSFSDQLAVVESAGDRNLSLHIYRWPTLQNDGSFLISAAMSGPWQFRSNKNTMIGVVRNRGPGQDELVELDTNARRLQRRVRVRNRDIRAVLALDHTRVAFTTQHLTSTVVYQNAAGFYREFRVEEGVLYDSPTVLGTGALLAIRQKGGTWNVVEGDLSSGAFRDVTPGPDDYQVAGLTGSDWLVARALPSEEGGPTVLRCSGISSLSNTACRPILSGYVYQLIASPTGDLVAYVVATGSGLAVRLMSPNGGNQRDLTNNATLCPLLWSGSRRLWVSRRNGAQVSWTEFSVDDLSSTGRTMPSDTACLDGVPDPRAPLLPAARVVVRADWDLRVGELP